MTRAILIDDEKNALELLEWQLQTYCPQVQIMAQCRSADEGAEAVRRHHPDLVFLDIEMPRKNGFDFLALFPQPSFEVIFITAYDQFAIRAFKFSALDYLLKPIVAADLVAAVQRHENRKTTMAVTEQLAMLLAQYQHPHALPAKLPFATQEGIVLVKPETLVHCTASDNYTLLHFTDKTKMLISKTLKDVEELLAPFGFFRSHHSHLVNFAQINRYVKTDGGYIEMCDGTQVPVSRQRREEVLAILLRK